MPHSYGWLIFGVVCFALEAFGLSGIGFFFAGLGAITVGVLIEMHVTGTGSLLGQFGWLFLSTTIWTIVLWKALKRFRMDASSPGYSNMIGDSGVVGAGGLSGTAPGQVKWSGTTMQAKLADNTKTLAEGARVRIVDVKGATLVVEPE